jgi:hypothetical protein
MKTLGHDHKQEERQLFTNVNKALLKSVLLHRKWIFIIPSFTCYSHNRSHKNMQLLSVAYNITHSVGMFAEILKSQLSFLACNLFYQVLLLFMWNSQAKDHHYSAKECPKHEQFNLDKVLPQLPYSPQLTSSCIHLFQPLKDTLYGYHFRLNEVVREAMYNWQAKQNGIYVKLEWVWRTWWALQFWLMSMHRTFLFAYFTSYNYSSFHLSDHCISRRKMKWECWSG